MEMGEHHEPPSSLGVDRQLKNLCQEWGVPEVYQLLFDKGIRFSDLIHLTDEDVNDFLPANVVRIQFRQNWKKWLSQHGVSPTTSQQPNSAERTKTRKRATWRSLSLSNILDCELGKRLITQFKTGKEFQKRHRSNLVDLILQHAADEDIPLTGKAIEELSEEIAQTFTGEKQEDYYWRKREGRKINYGGLLYRKNVYLKTAKKKRETHTKTTDTHQINPPSQEFSQHDSSENCLILDVVDAIAVIHEEFHKLFPDSSFSFLDWTLFFEVAVVKFLEENLKDKVCRLDLDKATGETDDEIRHRHLFLILPGVLPARSFVLIKQDGALKSKREKPTILECQNTLLVEIEDDEQAEKELKNLESYLKRSSRSFSPVIIFIEGQYRVYVTKEMFHQISTLQEAVSLTFKAIHVMHGGTYNIENGNIWFLVQKLFFNITTDKDQIYEKQCDKILKFVKAA